MTESEGRFVEGGDLTVLVDAQRNRDVLTYLQNNRPSCHSDTADALLRAAEKCGEWRAYSPSFQQLRFVALLTKGTIFALGLGQRSVCFRISSEFQPKALLSGANEALEIGSDWVRFELFRVEWPAPDLGFWALRAYAAARQ